MRILRALRVSALIGLQLLLVVVISGSLSSSAKAAAPGDPVDNSIRWSVSPADAEGKDGRRVISLDLEPGSRAQDAVRVHNISAVDVTFALTANDGYRTASGSFDMRPSDHVPQFGGAWITFADQTVKVPAGGEVIVPFEVSIPENATPGDHIAGVAASIRTDSGDNVATEHRVGVRVNLRVAGDVTAAADLTVADTTYEMNWNPFVPGRVILSAEVANSGNIRISGQLTGTAGGSMSAPSDGLEFLPGEARRVGATVEQVWPWGPISVTYTVAPQVVAAEGGVGKDVSIEPVTHTVTIWVIPWPQLAVLLLLVGLVLLIVLERRRRARRLQALLAQARAEGARDLETNSR